MQPTLRKSFNDSFSQEKYDAYIKQIDSLHPGQLDFRVAETPIFVPKDFTQKMLAACEDIIDVIISPDFKKITERSIPSEFKVKGDESLPQFIAFDFGVCESPTGPQPQLIEMQGFPSLFAYQACLDTVTRGYASVPENYSAYLNNFDKDSHSTLLNEILLAGEDPANVILLEIYPEKQKTRIDFACTEAITKIKSVCITKVIAEGDDLFYMNDGVKTQIKRIYNRLIFDDLQQNMPENIIDLNKDYNVTWVPHPNWFYRISKFTLPFIDNDHVPDTFFLHEMKQPVDLSQYVLKPLFSFAGMGVVIDVTQEDIDAIQDPENWILQKKVTYADIIETDDVKAKAEIRLFFFWKDGWARPKAVHNLARLSKGKMIGTRYNKDKTWVGGTIAYFEQ